MTQMEYIKEVYRQWLNGLISQEQFNSAISSTISCKTTFDDLPLEESK